MPAVGAPGTSLAVSFALAWRILTYDKGRTALAIAGVFMAILLVFVELGFFVAVPQGGMLLYDRMRFDLLLTSSEYEYQAQPGAFPAARLEAARQVTFKVDLPSACAVTSASLETVNSA